MSRPGLIPITLSRKLGCTKGSIDVTAACFFPPRRVALVLAMATQIPNNLAMHLHKGGAKILGTSPEMIDNAEDRWVAWWQFFL